MGFFEMAANKPLNESGMGSLPDVREALLDCYQAMVFTPVIKTTEAFEMVETGNPLSFRGFWQPLTSRALMLKPEGQRSWTWFMLHADPAIVLNTDDVVIWRGKQTRIMARKDYANYGYVYYELVQDWTGSGP